MAAGDELKQRNLRVIRRLLIAVVLMFGFGFLLVPLYDVLCAVTGLNGKTGGRYTEEFSAADAGREVKVQFVTQNNENMPWEFRPLKKSVIVTPGVPTTINFLGYNPTSGSMTAQAVPSVTPSRSAAYFHKTECFCFNQQLLEAGQSIEMPVRFIVDPELPRDIHTVTLSYTLFDITEYSQVSSY